MKTSNVNQPGERAHAINRGHTGLRAGGSGIKFTDDAGGSKVAARARLHGARVSSGGPDTADIIIDLAGLDLTPITPNQLTANTNDWDPVDATNTDLGLDFASVIRASTDASRNLTGIVAPVSDRLLILENVGSNNLVLKHDATSTAANRFYCPGSVDVTLGVNAAALLAYDETSARWRVVAVAGSAAAITGFATPALTYGTPAGGSASTVIRSDAVIAKPTAADVDFSADVTTNNASTSAHGLLKKLPNDAATFLDGQGNFSPLNISGVNLASGTSFPGSPATNDVFFRTDRGILYFYDGTRWLSVHLHQVPLTVYDQFDGTTTSPRDKSVALPNSDAIYLISGVVAGIVTGTNNGSNYWSFQFKTKSAPNTDTNRGSAVNTSADSVSTYFNKEVSIGAQLTTAALVGFCTAGKTGTPGNMYYFPTIKYRLIG